MMTGTVFRGENPVQSAAENEMPSEGSINRLDDRAAIAQRERATNRLAAVGEMTGGIAHDFRNLLAVIESGLRLAASTADEPDKARSYIAAAREGVDRGIELTSQLLTFAKHQELNAHAGDLNEFLRTFEPFLRYGAGPNVRVKLELGSNIPDCLIDPALFDAAVLNLVVNARDAMSNGGEVRIVTERLDQRTATPDSLEPGIYARVCVEDNGHGMPEKVLRRVFDPFFTTKGETGTGIGLSQVRAYAQMVGGRVRISSKPGLGTTVDLLFPSLPSND